MPLVYGQDERVSAWVAEQLGYPEGSPVYASIGYEVDGELIAAVTFDNPSDTNVFAHIASNALVLPLELLLAVARYVFIQNKLRRMTFFVFDDNTRCMRLVESLGAVREASLNGARKGGDLLIYALWDTSRFYRKLLATGRVAHPQETV